MSAARTYRLGIDLGTTYTAAVVCRRPAPDAPWSEPEIVALGSQSASVASVLYLGADGAVLVGEAAERRGLGEPDRVVRQFKRRIGDDVPLVVGDAVHTAHELSARLARWVVDKVAEREGGPADAVAITHPAAWGDHKKELLAGALRQVGLDGVTFLPEPQAAAVAYSARERVDAGGAVAVYDLGGGTFDAAVVGRTDMGFALPGRAEGIEQLGGVDFDDRVFGHVRDGIGAALEELDFEDPDVITAVMRLRRECTEAKEALSFDTQATIPVMLPGIRTNVRLTRVEFEAAIRGSIDHTVDALRRAVESAALAPEDLQAVLLVGGSSRIPLVAQMISAELGRPVAVDSDPKTSIATGAALTIAPRPSPVPPAGTNRRAPAPPPASPPSPSSAPSSAQAAAPVSAPVGDRPRESSGMLDMRAVHAQAAAAPPRPVEPMPGRYPAASAPPGRPPVGSSTVPAGPGRAGWPQEPAGLPPRPQVSAPRPQDGRDDAGAESGSRTRMIVIIVICALLVFGAAFAIGVWLTVSKSGSGTSSAPIQTTQTFSPGAGVLPPGPV